MPRQYVSNLCDDGKESQDLKCKLLCRMSEIPHLFHHSSDSPRWNHHGPSAEQKAGVRLLPTAKDDLGSLGAERVLPGGHKTPARTLEAELADTLVHGP